MANLRRGEHLLTLHRAGSDVAFTARLTFNGLCDALQALSHTYGRDFTVGDINAAIAGGFLNYVVLRELFLVSIQGQHGVTTSAEAGDLLEENGQKIYIIASALAQMFMALMPRVEDVEGLARALDDSPPEADISAGAEGNGVSPAKETAGEISNASATGSSVPASGR